ncbi:metalloprotease TIKI1-like [Diadema antillarum]|uniref:metalloprotease TIKI1-like n=1 Tax=Diadema antillarum TaxID=105358 RepID=UPI003A887E08
MLWWDVLAVFVLVFLPWPRGGASSIQDLREQLNCHRHTQGTTSFLWRVRREPPAYFFGTIHVPYTRVWDYIPENTKVAFRESEHIFFELDLMDPYTLSGLANCQLLPQGENLSDVLPESMFQRLKSHLEYVKHMMPQWLTADQRGRGVYADYLFNTIAGNWERKKPIWVMMMVNSLTETDVKSRGIPVLDLYLAQEAMRLNKRTGAVEQVEEQCIPLNGLNFSQEVFALNQTLWHQESLRAGTIRQTYTTEDLIWHYNCGDLNSVIFNQDTAQVPSMGNTTLTAAEIELANQIDRYFRQELIYKRNMRMAMRVKAILESRPKQSFFFALGAGHFLGNNTVIDVLRKLGMEIESIPAEVQLSSKTSESSAEEEEDQEETSEARGRKNRKRDRRKKKKKQQQHHHQQHQQQQPRLDVPDMGHVISVPVPVPVPVRNENHRQFNELWIPLERISENPPSESSHVEESIVTTISTQVYAAHNLPNVFVGNKACAQYASHHPLYLFVALHIALYIIYKIAR